jgi:predicted nucleic acid-binding protein
MDAGPMVALLSARDRHHRACRASLQKIREELVTVWPAVVEAMYLLGTPERQDLLWEMLLDENPRVLPLDLSDMTAMRRLMKKYADRPMDLADAALVHVAEREDIRKVFTIDRSDFAVYRVGGKPLAILP